MNTVIRRSLSILRSWRFLANVAVILIITSWIPLLSQTYTLKDVDGTVLQERTQQVRAWVSWGRIIRPSAPDFYSHLYAVSIHLATCLVISFAVWYVSLQWGLKSSAKAVEPAEPEEKAIEALPVADDSLVTVDTEKDLSHD